MHFELLRFKFARPFDTYRFKSSRTGIPVCMYEHMYACVFCRNKRLDTNCIPSYIHVDTHKIYTIWICIYSNRNNKLNRTSRRKESFGCISNVLLSSEGWHQPWWYFLPLVSMIARYRCKSRESRKCFVLTNYVNRLLIMDWLLRWRRDEVPRLVGTMILLFV